MLEFEVIRLPSDQTTQKTHLASCFGCQTGAGVASLLAGADSSSVNLEECQEWGREPGSFFLQQKHLTQSQKSI